jgi:hypothetical protein
MSELMRSFAQLEDENYPGSKQKRRESADMRRGRLAVERAHAKAEAPWDVKPRSKHLPDGRELEMFPIGSLAKALGRESVTIRRWIRLGWLPRARYQTPAIAGTRGNAGRRMWTRTQIEGIVRIAGEEGLLSDKPPQIQKTNFTRRVFDAWKGWL